MPDAAPTATTASPQPRAMSPQTKRLLEAPLLPTLLLLAWPNILVTVVQSGVSLAEAYFVSWLGTDAIAGVALVLPLVMLSTMISAGAMGGGMASAIARALGSGRRDDADALLIQSVYIALALGALATALILGFGPTLYRALGGSDAALAQALAYSNLLFAGSVFLFLSNALAAVLRGTGNMIVQSRVYTIGAALIVALSPPMIMGWGPFPALGTRGAALAVVLYYIGSTAVFVWYLLSGRALVKPSRRHLAPRWPLLADILKVGVVASLNAALTNITVAIITAILGAAGAAAIAGYGIGVRLEYILIPLVFGLGGPLVAMVGSNIGAGQPARARRVAWIGGALGFAVSEAIGLSAALLPAQFLGLFTDEADVIATGTVYLQIVGPVFGFFGGGMVLYFASQGTGNMTWPFLGGAFRLVVATGGGWFAFTVLDAGEAGLFLAVAVGMVVFGAVNAAAVALSPAWRTEN